MAPESLRGGDLALLITASVGCAMSLIDTNVIALASPAIGRALNAAEGQGRWIISAFFLGFATSLLPAGAIADRHGRRLVFLAGLLALALVSLLAGLAPAMGWLIWIRGGQGIAMAFVLAPSLALIGHRFRSPQARARAWVQWGSIMGLTMVTAPILGGLVVQHLGWRWAFFLNLPVCALLFAATLRFAGESRDPGRARLDLPGGICFSAMMFCLTWGLISGPVHGWTDPRSLGAGALALIALALLIAVERGRKDAMLELTLFTDRRFAGAVLAMFAYAVTAQVMASLLPVFLQTAGYSAAAVGFAVLPFTSAMLIFPHPGARLSARIGVERMLVLGLLVVALGNGAAALAAQAGQWGMFLAALFVLGAGAGLLNGETQKAIMMTIPVERTGIASGISTTARFSGVLIGFTALSGLIPAQGGMSGLVPALVAATGTGVVLALTIARLMRGRLAVATG